LEKVNAFAKKTKKSLEKIKKGIDKQKLKCYNMCIEFGKPNEKEKGENNG
jgi:hypothetical protein